TVDGENASAPRYLAWAPGETHVVAAPLRQADAAGAPGGFRAGSNGGPAAQTIARKGSQVDAGNRLHPSHAAWGREYITRSVPGITVEVDGTTCRTPCDVDRPPGTTVRISAPRTIPVSDGVRFSFTSWDGLPSEMFVTAAGYRRVVARYSRFYRMTLGMQPA